MSPQHDTAQNRLLAGIPKDQFDILNCHLELVSLPLGNVIYECGSQLEYAYFPTTCIISLLSEMADGTSAELALIGSEGVFGIAVILGARSIPHRVVVQSAGYAYRIIGKILKDQFQLSGPMQNLFLRYTQAQLIQMAQTAACNRHHSVDQQLCRWLLLSFDRLTSSELNMTQELIANMLGVRRQGVAEAAGNLQRAGLIRYCRGSITLLDRLGLEARVCECYAIVKKEFDTLLYQ